MNIRKEDVGKRVWDFEYGWGSIKSWIVRASNPVLVQFDHPGITGFYYENGRRAYECNQMLFWDEILFEEPLKQEEVKKTHIKLVKNNLSLCEKSPNND